MASIALKKYELFIRIAAAKARRMADARLSPTLRAAKIAALLAERTGA